MSTHTSPITVVTVLDNKSHQSEFASISDALDAIIPDMRAMGIAVHTVEIDGMDTAEWTLFHTYDLQVRGRIFVANAR